MRIEYSCSKRKKITAIALKIPQTYKIDQIAKEVMGFYDRKVNQPDFKKNRNNATLGTRNQVESKVAAMLGMVCEKQPTDPDGVMKDVFVPIPKKYIENLQASIQKIKPILVELGYLEVEKSKKGNEKYLVGEFCKRYKIPKKHQGLKKKFFINEHGDPNFIKSVQRLKRDFFKKDGQSVFGDFMEKKVRIDLKAALGHIEYMFETGEIDGDQYSSYYVMVNKIADGDFYVITDEFSERVHTNLTNLKSCLRKFIYFEGDKNEPLVSIDIKNSQILGLALLMDKERRDYIEGESERLDFSSIKQFDHILKSDDVKVFSQISENGMIYEDINEKMIYEGLVSKRDRKKTKSSMFTWLFSPYNCENWKKNCGINAFNNQIMGKYYNGVYSYVNNIRWMKDSDGEYNKNELPKLLQKLEVFFVMDKITPLLRERGVTDFLTIHDSFFARQKDADMIIRTVKEVFAEYGVDIKLGIEVYDKNIKEDTKVVSEIDSYYEKVLEDMCYCEH